MIRNILIKDLGILKHSKAMGIMKDIERKKIDFCLKKEENELPDTLILCEHHPVYTIGIRAARYTSDENFWKLKDLGAEVELTNRGGLVTFHGPGQLVCYPVFNLRYYNKSVRRFIEKMEEVIIRTCFHYGIRSNRTNDVGVWVENRKIAALGIHASNYITSHGLALNCNTDLSWFSNIDPCGIADKDVTSISNEIGKDITVDDVKPVILDEFSKCFQCHYL